MRPIFLLTDFGTADVYAGIMRAVIATINPDAKIYDLSHDIDKFNILQTAVRLSSAVPYLPNESIVLAVVDPHVGSERRAIAVRVNDKTFVCPDNGLLSFILRDQPVSQCVVLDRSEFHLPNPSSTFHGRDVFAPIAAHLSNGKSLSSVGSTVDQSTLTVLTTPHVEKVNDHSLRFGVIDVDSFGNIITSLRRTDLPVNIDFSRCNISIGEMTASGIRSTFSDSEPGSLFMYFGSSGFLEIAIREGNAASALGSTSLFVLYF